MNHTVAISGVPLSGRYGRSASNIVPLHPASSFKQNPHRENDTPPTKCLRQVDPAAGSPFDPTIERSKDDQENRDLAKSIAEHLADAFARILHGSKMSHISSTITICREADSLSHQSSFHLAQDAIYHLTREAEVVGGVD